MKKRFIPVLFAIVLIFIVAAIAFGAKIMERYSYSKERADLDEYFNLQSDDEIAIILQNDMIEAKAKLKDGVCYFDLPTVNEYFTDRFYANSAEQVLLFTTDTDVVRINVGDASNIMYVSDTANELGYKAAIHEEPFA